MQTNTLLTEIKGLLNRLNRINIDTDDLLILTEIDNLISDYEAVDPPIKDVWGFVEQYYPNYSTSDEIAYNDDLQKIVDEEIDGGAEDLYNDMIECEGILIDDIDTVAQNRLNESNAKIYANAIENFLNIQNKK